MTGDPARTAAWGEPPIRLRCGVALPDQRLEPLVIDSLSFVTTKSNGVITWTTKDRAVNASIDVPTAYEEQVYVVQPLVPALLAALPRPAGAPGA